MGRHHEKCKECGKVDTVENLVICGCLKVYGPARFQDEVRIKKDLTVGGTTTLNGSTIVNGTITFNGPIVIPGPITGPITVNGNLTVNGNEKVTGNLDVGGETTTEGGLHVFGGIKYHFDKNHLTYTVPATFKAKQHDFEIMLVPKTIVSYPLGFFDAPLSPNPLVYGASYPVAGGRLLVSPVSHSGPIAPALPPWYFRDLTTTVPASKSPVDPDGIRVLYNGIQEIFSPGAGTVGGPNPPVDQQGSVATITNPDPLNNVSFLLELRYSSEPNYDFVFVTVNGVNIFTGSGAGPTASNPYNIAEIPISLKPNDVLSITYNKDPAGYAGLDNIYLYLKNVVVSGALATPTKFTVLRNGVPVLEFANVIDFDQSLQQAITILRDFIYQKGDVIVLSFDTNAYDDVIIDFTSIL